MIGSEANLELFESRLLNLYKSIGEQDPLAKFRSRAWDHFLELGLPSRKTSEFQYLPLRKLYSKEIVLPGAATLPFEKVQAHIVKGAERSVAVFINGQFQPLLSRFEALPKKAVAVPLFEAFRMFGSFLHNQSARTLQEETDPFVSLNGAFTSQSLFIYLPPNTICEKPIQILHFVTADSALISPRIEFFLGALAETKVLATTVYLGGNGSFVNGALHFSLEEGARAHLERMVFGLPETSWQFDAVRTFMKKDSYFNSLMATDGAETVRDDYRVVMVGPNAEALLNGCWMLDGTREAHTHVKIDHQAPFCHSNQLFKGVLDGVSRSSFEGKIYIQKAAQKTEAYQLNQNLVLSKGAQAYTKPNLEIFAADVKASHGATIGKLDDEQLFYLEARGLSKKKGKELLVRGFSDEVLNKYAFLKRPS